MWPDKGEESRGLPNGCVQVLAEFVIMGELVIFSVLQGGFMKSDSPRPTCRELLHAKLDALLDECDLVADNAAFGQTLNDMEEFFLLKGRKFLQETFQEIWVYTLLHHSLFFSVKYRSMNPSSKNKFW